MSASLYCDKRYVIKWMPTDQIHYMFHQFLSKLVFLLEGLPFAAARVRQKIEQWAIQKYIWAEEVILMGCGNDMALR